MAKLIIYRGDTLDREVDLGERNARIGRGDQNDIVLPDPAKSVSRFHAELRFDQGRFSVVDLNSQNGIWVAGRRVPQATLEPGVPVVLGTYRLVLKEELPPPSATPETTEATLLAAPAPAEPSSAATMAAPPRPAAAPPPPPAPKLEPPGPVPKPAPVAAPVPEPKPAPKPEPPPAPKVEPPPPPKVEAPKPVPKADAAPAPKVEPPRPAPPVAARPKPAPSPGGKGMSKGLLFGGFAVVVLAVMAAAVFLTPLKNQLASLTGSQPAGDAARPPESQPAAEPPPPAAPATVKPATPRPAQAPAQKPAATPSGAVKAPGETTPARVPRERAAGAGGRRGAAAPEAKPKPLNLSQTLEAARSAMIKGDYLAAIAGFESILKVDPKYPAAADLLGVARGGAKNASQLAVDSGNKAEMGGDYAGAIKQYERAQQLDPESTAAPDAVRRLKARMQSEGEDVFKRARQYDALGRAQDAISMYEKAIQLLPPGHANAVVAKERLAALKGGH